MYAEYANSALEKMLDNASDMALERANIGDILSRMLIGD